MKATKSDNPLNENLFPIFFPITERIQECQQAELPWACRFCPYEIGFYILINEGECLPFATGTLFHAAMTQALTTKLQSFFATQPVEKAWVFGSFSRGEETVRLERILAEENA